MRKLSLSFFCLLLLSASAAFGSNGGDEYRVAQVRFHGVEKVSKKNLSKTLSLQLPPFWKFWAEKPTVTVSELEEDVLRIRHFYQEHGYYETRVSFQTDFAGPPPLAVVTFRVEEGPPVLIEQIKLHMGPGTEDLSGEALLKTLPLKEGQVFEVPEYRRAKELILKYLGNRGYPFSRVEGNVIVDTREERARIAFDLRPGRKCAFGPLSITGNEGYVKEVVIRRAMDFEEGETFAAGRVEKSQKNLFDMDLFRTALITPQEPVETEEGDCRVPMSVQVKQKKRQSVRFGLGYGSEDGFRVKAAWIYRNLFGYGGNLSVTGKRSDLILSLDGSYIQPYFLGKKNTLKIKTGFEEEDFVSYTTRKLFTEGFLSRRLLTNWTASLGYNLQVNDPVDLKLTDPAEIEEFNSRNSYFISSIKAALTRETVDDLFSPTRGSVLFGGLEYASTALGSELSFLQPALEIKKFHPLFDHVVLAGRVRLDTIQPTEATEQIPIFKRLFLGGANTVRGYGFQMLGPLDENEKPIGGLSSFLANLEMRFPLYDKISGVLFVDMGLVDESSFSYSVGDMRYTTGVGLRYETPVGPIRLDFGYKLNPPTRGDVGLTTNPDDPVEGRWRIEFSVGQAF